MNDLISRQDVLKLPRNVTRNFFGKIVEESIDVERIEALPSAYQWIPVSEKPEEDGEYLTTIISKDDNGIETDRLMVSVLFENGRWKLKGSEVVAWMPIEPWKGDMGGENDEN